MSRTLSRCRIIVSSGDLVFRLVSCLRFCLSEWIFCVYHGVFLLRLIVFLLAGACISKSDPRVVWYCIAKSSMSLAGFVHNSLSFRSEWKASMSKSLNDLLDIVVASLTVRRRDRLKHSVK